MAAKAKTTMTFSVTLEVPSKVNIPSVRQFLKDAIQSQQSIAGPMEDANLDTIKISLTNKEVSYGKR